MTRETHRHSFVRADGSRFFLDLEIDLTKLSRNMAEKMVRNDHTTATRCGGSVKATLQEVPG